MKKSLLLPIALLLIGAGCAPAAPAPQPVPPVVQAPPPAAKIVEPSKLRAGDAFHGWRVAKVTDLQGDGAATPESYSITLKGPMTVTGTWHYFMDEGVYGTFIMIFKPEAAAEDTFPGAGALGFMLANKKDVLADFGIKDSVEASGTATVIVDDYNFQGTNTEGYPAASLVKVVTK